VTERFREIGTMKCLGALSSFIRRIFFIESALLGLVGSLAGSAFGLIFAVVLYAFSYGWILVLGALPWGWIVGCFAVCSVGGVAAAVIAAIYPAGFASRMVPATALRTNI
jgi:ABC-type lipoprotein release transport system permease subunit